MNSRDLFVLTMVEQSVAVLVFLIGIWVMARTNDTEEQVEQKKPSLAPKVLPAEKPRPFLIQTKISEE